MSAPHSTRSVVSFLALALALLAACAPSPGAQMAPAGPPPPPAVGVEAVEVRKLVEHADLTGRLGPVESVDVRPRISGYIDAVAFEPGELVKKDQVLFRIDPRWNRAAVDQHKAELAASEARVAVAERELERAKKLDARAISAEEVEARNARVLEARAARAAAQAALTSSELDLEYTEVKAPIAGRIGRALVTAGNYVSGAPGANTVLASIVSVDPVYFYADLDEATYLRFEGLARAGKAITVELGLSDETGYPRQGVLESLDNQVDAASGTILLRASFANADGRLVPGLFARARVPIGEAKDELCIDDRAVGTDQNQKFVLVVGPGDVAEYRKVKLGPVQDGRRIVREGLKAGERIVVTGLQKTRPGTPVKPEPLANGAAGAGGATNAHGTASSSSTADAAKGAASDSTQSAKH
ncbi:MAG: efflux RND transporter periplasmic adaptor subunit [Planctomycetes bacterium]|nr:efflux RND transporter periplasmic adaptor subunit [Planctomycetota bacterium]